MPWSNEEINRIITADDLHIAPFREDGVSCGTPTWVWCVAVEGQLYVRAYSGPRSRWYQAAIRERAGQIIAAGITWPVAFEPVAQENNSAIDEAYRGKYQGSPYLQAMISQHARAATVKITPRSDRVAR
jgi:hypothetical protein